VDESLKLVITFASGVAVTGIGAAITNILTKKRDRESRIAKARLDVYMDLLHLHSTYFWVTCAEVNKEQVPSEIKNSLRSLTWKIADKLRAVDDLEEIEEVLQVLFSDDFDSAVKQWMPLSLLWDKK
jgi:hypothetical protein